jgi:hypothetical protein
MMAAAKCPSCGHLFELRDGSGKLLPLSYCSSCDSYYPETAKSCRWCGTQPERPPVDARIWRGIGIGAAAIIGGVWLIQNAASKGAQPPRPKTAVAVAKTPPTTALDTDIAMARAIAAANDSLSTRPVADTATPALAPVTIASDAPPKAEQTPKVEAPPKAETSVQAVPPGPSMSALPKPATSVASAPNAAVPNTAASSTVSSAKRLKAHWVRSVSRHWVIVRSGASKESRIIASIGPNSRVELGESRGDWRRIRTKGITGWVEPRSSFEVVAAR